MDWEQYQIALRMQAEERIGRRIRQVEAAEEADFAAAKKALQRG